MVARQLAAFLVSCSLFPAEEQMMQTTFAFSPQSLRMPRARSILSTPKSTVQLPTLSTTTIKITPIITSLNSQTGESGYIPPELSQELQPTKPPPFPKVGDLVRYYDLDGGNVQGQELVGKLSFIQSRKLSKEDESREWLGEVTELDNVGDGYYAEYPSRKRRKSKLLPLASLAPLVGSYVRNEDAFKIPTDGMGNVKPLFPAYNLVGYEGPVAIPVNQDVWESDMEKYGKLKGQLLKDALLAGLIGTAVAGLVAGLDTALVYFAGAIAGVGYLFFLSVKTDTLGSPDAKLGTNVSNVRFALPFLVLVGIAIMNLASGGVEVSLDNVFNSVSKEQFGAAMLGFLTYRLPLFVSQLAPIVGESAGIMLPGSAGIAMQMAKEAKEASSKGKRGSLLDEDLTTVFVVSGPVGTGKSELCKQLVEESEGKLITPTYLDKVADPIIFEQLEGRDELLQVDATGRYALTKDSIFKSVGKFKDEDGEEQNQVLVIDADVKLTKKLTSVGGIRLVGVWVGLDALEKFETRLDEEIQSGKIPIPPDEDAESVRRGKIREIVKDIEYGVVSGIFEFTILNDDPVDSLKQLKSAAQYCFD